MSKELREAIITADCAIRMRGLNPLAFQAIWYALDDANILLDFEVVIDENSQGFWAKTKRLVKKGYPIRYGARVLQSIKPYSISFDSVEDGINYIRLWGRFFSKRYNVPFYFPSPDHWDDGCPKWWEQEREVRCGNCGKPIIPSDSEHLSEDLCYNCHLTKSSYDEYAESMKSDSLDKDEQYLSLFEVVGDSKTQILYRTTVPISNLVLNVFDEYVQNILGWGLDEPLKVELLTEDELEAFKSYLEAQIKEELAAENHVDASELKESHSRWYSLWSPKIFVFDGKSYSIFSRGLLHRRLYELFFALQSVERLIFEKGYYRFCYRNGLRYREGRMIDFLHKSKGNPITLSSLLERFGDVITGDDIIAVLERLIALECVTLEKGGYMLLEKGVDLLPQ